MPTHSTIKQVEFEQLREGSRVMVRGSFGNGPAKEGLVDEVSDDIKNGCPGIGYTVNGENYWAYLDQIVQVLTY